MVGSRARLVLARPGLGPTWTWPGMDLDLSLTLPVWWPSSVETFWADSGNCWPVKWRGGDSSDQNWNFIHIMSNVATCSNKRLFQQLGELFYALVCLIPHVYCLLLSAILWIWISVVPVQSLAERLRRTESSDFFVGWQYLLCLVSVGGIFQITI